MKHSVWKIAGTALLAWHASSLAAVTNLLDLSKWTIYGTASLQGSTLTIGDSIGYDPSDADHDGNPYSVWYAGGVTAQQGVDYDEVLTVEEFAPPFKLSWTGCFPATSYGYNNIFLGRKNAAFTGAANSRQYLITQEFGITARWDFAGLNTAVVNVGNYDIRRVASASLSGSSYCGDFRIEWTNDLLQFFYNGSKVREQRYAYVGPVSIVVRSFDLPHTLTAMSIETGPGRPQNPATSRGVGSVTGSNLSGSQFDQATGQSTTLNAVNAAITGGFASSGAGGQSTTLNAGNAAIAGDLSFAFNEAGELIAHISGSGAAEGVAYRFEVDYDTATQNLTGTVADNNNRTPRAITFTNKGGLAWQGRVQATAGHSATGAPITYDISFDILLPAEAIYAAEQFPPGGRFTVDLAGTHPVSIPISIPELGVNRTESTSVITDGSFIASLVPGAQGLSLTGNIEGAFRMDPPLQFTVAYTPFPGISVNIPIAIDTTGRFSGALSGNTAQNNLRFIGEWSSVASDGTAAGGTMEMAIPLDPVTGSVPSTAQLAIRGAATSPVVVSGVPAGYLPPTVPTSVTTPISIQVPIPLVFH